MEDAVTNLLPGLIALVVITLVSIVIALTVRILARRILQSIEFDERVNRWGFEAIADWSPERSPSLLVTRIAAWSVLVLGLLLGLSAFDPNLSGGIMQLVAYLPSIFTAFVIFLAGILIARFLARGVLIGAVNMHIHSARLLSAGVKWLVNVLASAMALEHLRIGGAIVQLAFAILFGGIVLTLALAVGLGSKEMVSRSWERQTAKTERETEEDTFRHI
jgi:hypothetical protein